ncbi:putative F-box domain-containing protein [Tanacetum coccineum]
MSDNIPFEIQEEIMKRVPIKPLLQVRSVSKAWKSLIDSSEFIAAYQHTEHHILVRDDFEHDYVSVADDDTFPHQKVKLKPSDFGMRTAVIWNPTIKKSISVDVPIVLRSKKYNTYVCFGVCPRTLDPMLVNISIGYWWEEVNSTTDTTLRVLWNMEKPIYQSASEEFREIRLPDNLAFNLDMWLYLCKSKESLVVIHYEFNVEKTDWDVWMMEIGDPESFRKIHTIKSDNDDSIVSVFGSRKSAEPLVEVTKCFHVEKEDYELFVYNPNSEQTDYVGISAKYPLFFVSAYTETLLRYKLRTKAMSTSETVELIKSCSTPTATEVFGKLDVLCVDSCLTPR